MISRRNITEKQYVSQIFVSPKSRWTLRHGWGGENHTRLMKPVAHFFTSSGRLATATEEHRAVHCVQIQVRRGSSLLVAERKQTNSAEN